MKKILMVVVAFTIISGCVAREQSIKQQVYSCTVNPKVSLKINDDLIFIRSFDRMDSVYAPDASHFRKKEALLFAKTENAMIIENALVITTKQLLQEDVTYVLKCSWNDGDSIFLNEYSKFLGKRSCRIVGVSNKNFFRILGVDLSVTDLNGSPFGYYFEYQHILLGGRNSISYTVTYFQKIKTPLKSNDFPNGLSEEELSPEQEKEYRQFLESSRQAFQQI